jgi:hypothetical protein
VAKGRFVYRGGDRTVEELNRRGKQLGGGYDSYLQTDLQMFKPKEGENTIRILPRSGEPYWELPIHVHFGVGPDEATYLCLKEMKGEECPVCEARLGAADKEESDAMRPKGRALCWLIDRNDQKSGPQLWAMPGRMFRDLRGREVDRRHGGVIKIDDPEEGYDITFSRTGTGNRTAYESIEVDRESSPIHQNEKQQEAWLDYVVDHALDDVLNYYEAEYIGKVMTGRARKASNDEPDAEANGRVRSRGRAPDPQETSEADAYDRSPRNRRAASADEAPADDGGEAPTRERGRSRFSEEDTTNGHEEPTSRRASRRDDHPAEDDTADAYADPPPRSARDRVRPTNVRGDVDPDGGEEPTAQARRGLENLRNRKGSR